MSVYFDVLAPADSNLSATLTALVVDELRKELSPRVFATVHRVDVLFVRALVYGDVAGHQLVDKDYKPCDCAFDDAQQVAYSVAAVALFVGALVICLCYGELRYKHGRDE